MWDQRYASETYAYGTEANDFLSEHAVDLPVGRTLSLGEGEGRNAVYLAALGHEVTALDASIVGLNKANKLAFAKGLEIRTEQVDLAEYKFSHNAWDTIISIFCHLPPAVRIAVHHQVFAALKPGGIFILEAYTPEQLQYGTGGPPALDMMMQLEDLKQELRGLEFLLGVERVRDVLEGEFHNGPGAVVQVIAQKP